MIKDKVFIFLTVVLILLFTVKILENVFFSASLEEYKDTILFEQVPAQKSGRIENNTPEILTRLREAGLDPAEASYYKVIHE